MKIHGTAKGGALSTKDFGVAFGGTPVVPCELAATDFDVVQNWAQSPTGTVTWSSGTPNYARNSTLITGSNWEFTCNPEDSNWGTNTICRAGVSLTTTPTDPEYFNFDWFIYNGGAGIETAKIYYHRTKPDGSGATQTSTDYDSGAIYSIKCVDNVVSWKKDGVNVYTEMDTAYNFDADINTAAYFSVGAAQNQEVVWICESYANCTP